MSSATLQNQQIQATNKGVTSLVSQVAQKVTAIVPGLRKFNAEKLYSENPEFEQWAKGGKGKTTPLVPPMAEMEQAETMAMSDPRQPALNQYKHPLLGAAAYAAHKKYDRYNENPVATNWDVQSTFIALINKQGREAAFNHRF